MKAFILAAGRGERLRPLTDTTPKPLIKVGQHLLIEYHLYNLADAGIRDVVINISWLGKQIQEALGDGDKYKLNIRYSDEGDDVLETAGGIINALPLIGDAPFIVINSDIWSDFDLSRLVNQEIASEAHLILVDNPDNHPEGDFGLDDGTLCNEAEVMYTYSGIGIYTASFFDGLINEKISLTPILRNKVRQQLVSGEYFDGRWADVGRIERLEKLAEQLSKL